MASIDQETLRKDLREFIVESFLLGDDSEELNDTDSFMQKGIIDSTGVLELAAFVEEKYEIKVEDEDMVPANLDSIENLAGFISGKMN